MKKFYIILDEIDEDRTVLFVMTTSEEMAWKLFQAKYGGGYDGLVHIVEESDITSAKEMS